MNTKTGTDDSVRVLIHAWDRAGDVLDKAHLAAFADRGTG